MQAVPLSDGREDVEDGKRGRKERTEAQES